MLFLMFSLVITKAHIKVWVSIFYNSRVAIRPVLPKPENTTPMKVYMDAPEGLEKQCSL